MIIYWTLQLFFEAMFLILAGVLITFPLYASIRIFGFIWNYPKIKNDNNVKSISTIQKHVR